MPSVEIVKRIRVRCAEFAPELEGVLAARVADGVNGLVGASEARLAIGVTQALAAEVGDPRKTVIRTAAHRIHVAEAVKGAGPDAVEL